MDIQRLLPGVKENILLEEHTTFHIGGPAKYFFATKTKKDLIKAIKVAKKLKLPFFILGGGSNLLVSDKGFKGLVIKMQNSKCKVQNKNLAFGKNLERFAYSEKSKFKITCEAGVSLAKLISESLKTGATGLEWAAGIPGTAGGSICGNAGASGESMEDVIKEVEVFDSKTEKIKIFKNEDCKFGYRESIFKKNPKLIIISATLQLKKGDRKEIKKKIKENLNRRIKAQPLKFPSAGSIFKNPSGFSAWELIDKCGLKGKRIGNVKISEKHANFIVNLGSGRAKDVIKLINLAKKRVKNKFGVFLREEIQYLGM
jgi:UDP-N-acetylmuramate dehydrogenase